MKIDRSAFLLMTGAIAAAQVACQVQIGGPPPSAPPTTPAAPVAATATPAPAAPAAPTTGPRRVGTHSLFGGFTHDNTGITQPPGSNCLDENPATNIPACTAGAGSTCAAQVTSQCGIYGQVLEPKIAASAVQCLSQQSAASQCTAGSIAQCGQQALALACPSTDSGAIQACQQASAVAACGVTQQSCLAQVSGFSQAGVQALSTCIVEGGSLCATNSLAACVQKIVTSGS